MQDFAVEKASLGQIIAEGSDLPKGGLIELELSLAC